MIKSTFIQQFLNLTSIFNIHEEYLHFYEILGELVDDAENLGGLGSSTVFNAYPIELLDDRSFAKLYFHYFCFHLPLSSS